LVAIVKEKFEAVFKNLFKPLSDLTKYQYNLAGNLTKADHVHNEDHDEEFIYDGAYRLTQYYKDANDEINRVSQDWTVDGVYNWTEFTDYGTTEDRLYDSVNELTAINTNNDADFLYDKNGNLTKWTDDPEEEGEVVKEFYWDGLNRLTKIKVAGNDEAIFIYDTNNQRVRKEYDTDDDGDIDTDDDIIAYVWANGHVIEEYVNPADAGYSLDRNYVHGNMFIDELILFEDSSDDYHYYLQDFRYTVYALGDDTGTVEERYRFDPYGKRTVVTDDGSIDEHYGFTGRYHDDSDDTDLIYFRNRWLSPEIGRFISRDPLYFIDGLNFYTAWFGVLKTDAFGYCCKHECTKDSTGNCHITNICISLTTPKHEELAIETAEALGDVQKLKEFGDIISGAAARIAEIGIEATVKIAVVEAAAKEIEHAAPGFPSPKEFVERGIQIYNSSYLPRRIFVSLEWDICEQSSCFIFWKEEKWDKNAGNKVYRCDPSLISSYDTSGVEGYAFDGYFIDTNVMQYFAECAKQALKKGCPEK